MNRWIVMTIVLGMVFVGCNKPADQSVPEVPEKEAPEKTVEAIPKETAKAGDEDSDVKSCLQNVSEAKYNEAISVCLEALKSHPDNDQVKEALDEAKAAVSDAAAVATDAAQDAVQDVAQDVQKAAEEKAKGAIDEAIGGLAQ